MLYRRLFSMVCWYMNMSSRIRLSKRNYMPHNSGHPPKFKGHIYPDANQKTKFSVSALNEGSESQFWTQSCGAYTMHWSNFWSYYLRMLLYPLFLSLCDPTHIYVVFIHLLQVAVKSITIICYSMIRKI